MITATATIKPRQNLSKKAELNARDNREHTRQWTHVVIKCSQWGNIAWAHASELRRQGHQFQKRLAVCENQAKQTEPDLLNMASYEVSHTLALWAWHSMLKKDDKLNAEDQPKRLCIWGIGMTEDRWNLREKQDARNVQYPGLTLGQQPIKSNMRTFVLHQFCTGTSGQDVCICLKEKARVQEIQRNSGKC